MSSQLSKEAFVSVGYSNWSKALQTFKSHEKSRLHLASVQALQHLKKSKSVIQHLSDSKLKEMIEARIALRKIFETLLYMGKEGIPFRGTFQKGENLEDSKFIELLKLRAKDVPQLDIWLKRSGQKWLHHSILEEILKSLANDVLNGILLSVRDAKYYSIMVDETSDISRLEQVSICFRYVDENLNVIEDFAGFYETKDTKAETLFCIVKDVLTRFKLDLSDMRGQCFDGAANVSGDKSGLQTRIRESNPLALFVHCVAHRLNLTVQDTLTGISSVRDFIGNVRQMITFVRDSPRRLNIFKDLQSENAPTLLKYCTTRWCVRIKSLKTVRDNYQTLINFFDEISNDPSTESAAAAAAASYLAKFESFDFFFHLKVLIYIFECVENLNTTLQKIDLNLTQSHLHVQKTAEVLQHFRDDGFSVLWDEVVLQSKNYELGLPVLPRVRKAPKRYDSDSSPHVFSCPEEHYRKLFFEIVDLSLTSLNSRFESDTIQLLDNFESFIIKKTESPEHVMKFYERENFDADRLTLHRNMIIDLMTQDAQKYGPPKSTADIVKYLRENLNVLELVSEMRKLIRIILTVPSSTCTCERCFSALRRLKTYLRSTLLAERLNHLSILHVHRNITHKINIEALMDEFILKNNYRKTTFALSTCASK